MYNNENYDEFEALLNEYLPAEEKTKVRAKGVIAQRDRNFAYLDVQGQPTSVRVRNEELLDYNIGDEVEILLVGETEDGEFIIGSRRRIDMENSLKRIEEAFENKEILTGKIVKRIKGGYIVEALFHQGFLPNSLSEINMNEGDNFIGKEVQVMIKDIQVEKDKKTKKITFSRKDITLQKEEQEFSQLKVGDVVKAEVTDILDFGLLVKIGHLKGFVHISEISWKKLEKLTNEFKKGDIIEGVVISLEAEKKNVKLSIKALTRNPWEVIAETVGVDSVVDGKVTKLLPYGA